MEARAAPDRGVFVMFLGQQEGGGRKGLKVYDPSVVKGRKVRGEKEGVECLDPPTRRKFNYTGKVLA